MCATKIRQAPTVVTNHYNEFGPAPSVERKEYLTLSRMEYDSDVSRARRVKPVDLFANPTPWYRESAVTNYDFVEMVTNPYANQRTVTLGPAYYWSGVVQPPLPPFPDLQSFGPADLKMRNKIRNEKVDLYSSIAELGQTSDMMFGLFRDLTSAVKRFKSGQTFATLVRTLQAPRDRNERRVANRWLEYQYGVLPTLEDIYGLAEAAVTKANVGIPHYLRTAHVDKLEIRVNAGLVTGTCKVKTKTTVKARYVIRNSSLAKATELGLTNPVASLWNLMPWSFVIDWAFSVGDFLQGFDALLGVESLVVQRGAGRDIDIKEKIVGASSEFDMPIQHVARIRQRFPVSGDLSYGAPNLHNPFGGPTWDTRLANATALLKQFRR